jgi:hypothetical protein
VIDGSAVLRGELGEIVLYMCLLVSFFSCRIMLFFCWFLKNPIPKPIIEVLKIEIQRKKRKKVQEKSDKTKGGVTTHLIRNHVSMPCY